MADERELIAGFKSGDEEAIRAIVAQYGGALQTVARSMTSSPDLAAEVVQQTFVKAWRGAASFDPDRRLAPWLYSICRRTAIDVMRKHGRTSDTIDLDTVQPGVEGMTFERTWQIHEVRRALDALPADERSIVRLSFLGGLTHEQIAEELGIPIGTVKSRSARARQRLATALAHIGSDENQTVADDVQGSEEHQ